MKYRIKEECKKYFTPVTSESEQTIDEWYSQGIHDEALEEVESKIEIGHKINKFHLEKFNGAVWADSERELVEFCLNEFGDLDKMIDIIFDFAEEKPVNIKFIDWLKDRK